MKTTKKTTKKATKSAKPKEEPRDSIVEPQVEVLETPEILEVPVIGLANNPRFVYAGLDGNRIAVEVPSRLSSRLLRKTIKVVKQLDSDTYAYHGN